MEGAKLTSTRLAQELSVTQKTAWLMLRRLREVDLSSLGIDSLETLADGLTWELPMEESNKPRFYEFFAGGGMARAGLGEGWQCTFANDFDIKKGATYKKNWRDEVLLVRDVGSVTSAEVPGVADLTWASFPCQDLSIAGMGAGLRGDRSGTFWPFWRLMETLRGEGRGSRVLVLENVCGTLTSHQGRDFQAIAQALTDADYQFGAVVMDAASFLPHSRPRLFIIAIEKGKHIPSSLARLSPSPLWHTQALRNAQAKLSPECKEHWVWWNMGHPPRRSLNLESVLEPEEAVVWHGAEETNKLLGMMSRINTQKLLAIQKLGKSTFGTAYRRTRADDDGAKVQRIELRFDQAAGCLRTPAGGSSRQIVVHVVGDRVQTRLITARETARLMGLNDTYELPENYNEAYHLTGDGVAVPVVRFLAQSLLEPLLRERAQ